MGYSRIPPRSGVDVLIAEVFPTRRENDFLLLALFMERRRIVGPPECFLFETVLEPKLSVGTVYIKLGILFPPGFWSAYG